MDHFTDDPAPRRGWTSRPRTLIAVAACVGVLGGGGAAFGARALDDSAPASAGPTMPTPGPAADGPDATPAPATPIPAPTSAPVAPSAPPVRTASATAPRASTPSPAARTTSTSAPLWATTTAIHDGDLTIPLKGVTFIEHLQRAGGHWFVQDVPDGSGPYVRLLRVSRDGTTKQVALVTPGGEVNSSGTRYLGRARDDAHYELWDLATGRSRLLTSPPRADVAEGTALFAGDDVITGWGRTGTIYYRSRPTGASPVAVGLGPADAQFSPDRRTYAGLTGDSAQCLSGGPATDAKPAWTTCPGTLGNAPAFSPDGSRLVAYDHGDGAGDVPGAPVTNTVSVRSARTGRVLGTIPLPDQTIDVAMVANDRVVVLSVQGEEGSQTSSITTCGLDGACTAPVTTSGVAVLGGTP